MHGVSERLGFSLKGFQGPDAARVIAPRRDDSRGEGFAPRFFVEFEERTVSALVAVHPCLLGETAPGGLIAALDQANFTDGE